MAKPFAATRDSDGAQGFVHTIRGEQRFIPNDPEATPGAEVFIGDQQIAGGAPGAALIGFGETLENTGLRFEAAVDTLGGETDTEAQQEFAEVKQLLAPLEAEHPFATAIGQSVPGFLLPAARVAQTVGGVAEGVLADPENPILSGAIGGAAGFLGGTIGQKLASRVAARGTGAAARLTARGVPTTLAQRSGSEAERTIEAGLQAIPVINRWAAAPARAQQSALNRGAASVFGFEGALTPKGLGQIKAGISRSFQQVERAIPDQQIPEGLLTSLTESGVMDKATREFIELTGVADGEALMAIRSALNDDMADAFLSANRKEGRQLKFLLGEVDDLITSSMPDALQAQWATARQQWRFLTALRKGKAISGEGNVNLASMNSALNKIYPNFRVGTDLPGAAQGFGELVQALDELPKALQTSGTAERAVAAAALTGGGIVAPGTTAGGVGLATLATARAVGQPGVAAGGVAGRQVGRAIEGPISETVNDLLAEPEPAAQ